MTERHPFIPASGISFFIERVICRYWLAFGLFIFLSAFFLAPSQHHYKLIVTDLLLLPALFAAVSIRHWRELWQRCRAITWIGVYLLYFTLNDLWHKNEDASEYIQWSVYLILFLFTIGKRLSITDEEFINLFSIATMVAALAGGFAAASDWHAGNLLKHDYRLIGYGSLYNPLRSAEIFGAFAVIGVWCAQHSSSTKMRNVTVAAALLCLATSLLTGSRSPLIGQLAAALFMIFIAIERDRRHRWLTLLVISSVFIAATFWQALSQRGASLRPEIWGYVWRLCQQHPWIGLGLNSRAEIPTSTGAIFSDTHNIFLNALYSGGFIGLLLLVLLFASFGRIAWKNRNIGTSQLILALLIYSFVTLQFDGGSLLGRPGEFWLLLWLPVALSIRVSNQIRSTYAYD